LFGPDSSHAKHVIKLVDATNAKAVRRLCWEADMLECARQEGGLLGSVLPDVVGLYHDKEVRPQAPVDAIVWRVGGVRPSYHAFLLLCVPAHVVAKRSEAVGPTAPHDYLCRPDLDKWQAL
jgi:hypothetical protein